MREAMKRANHERILDAAARIMSTRPLGEVRAADIAHEAGLSVETINKFGTRGAIYSRVLKRELTDSDALSPSAASLRATVASMPNTEPAQALAAALRSGWNSMTAGLWVSAEAEALADRSVRTRLELIEQRRLETARAVMPSLNDTDASWAMDEDLLDLTSARSWLRRLGAIHAPQASDGR